MILPPRRTGHAPPDELVPSREGLAKAVAAGAWATDPAPVEERIGGVRILRWGSAEARATMLHFHGGGYRLGCPEMEGPFALRLAQRCRVEVVVPQYGLAPEQPFPNGLYDALAVLRATTGERPVFVSGGSAGGGLAAALALLAAAEGIALAGLTLHSPWLDLAVDAASYEENAALDALFSRASAESAAALYLQGHDCRDPLASPLLAEPHNFPPTLISVGTGEVLADDARSFAARLGEKADLLLVPGMEHVAVTRAPGSTGADQVFEAVCAFIETRLA